MSTILIKSFNDEALGSDQAATSTMFISKPLSDDHLPASPDGNIADVNVSAFQTGIDGLLAAAR